MKKSFFCLVISFSFAILFFSCASVEYKSFEDCEITKSSGVNASHIDWGGERITDISEPNSIHSGLDDIEEIERNSVAE